MNIWVDIFSLVPLVGQLPVWCVAVLVGIERAQKSFASISENITHISVSPLELCSGMINGFGALGLEVVCIKLRVGVLIYGWF